MVVRDTVVALVETLAFAGLEVCGDASVAANRMVARHRFFTDVLDLGETKNYLIFSIFVDVLRNEKNRKGWHFGNAVRVGLAATSLDLHGMTAIAHFAPTTTTPPSG